MEPLRPSDPRTVGGYRLLRRIGAGGMGQVYLGRSAGGRAVAVKLVKPEVAEEAEFRHRFRLEVEAARRVGGAWTAPVLSADTEAEVPWVATGYLAGLSLHTVVAEEYGALPESSVRALAAGLAGGLRAIHAAGIVHRDLKPSNVLVTVGGPRIIDFGIARTLESLASGGLRTMTGAVLGSPGFMSPEQVRGEPVTPASDVFCLGAVLAFAATARLPFGRADSGAHAVMFRIAEGEPDLTGLPPALLPLVRGCLARVPRDRLTTGAVLALSGPGPGPGSTGAPGARGGGAWLPGEVLTRLGRQSELLLEFEELPDPGPGPAAGTHAATEVAIPVRSGGPGASAPGSPPPGPSVPAAPGSPPPRGVFGAPYTPVTESPLPHPAPTADLPADSPEPALLLRRRRRRAVRSAAVVLPVLLLLAAGGWLLARSGDRAERDPWAHATAPSPSAGERSDLPQTMIGAWEGSDSPAGRDGNLMRVELYPGQVGTGVGLAYSAGPENMCVRRLVLVEAGERLTLDHAETLRRVPADSCGSREDHTRTVWLQGDVLHWEDGEGRVTELRSAFSSPAAVPAGLLGEWEADRVSGGTRSKLHLTVRQGGFGAAVEQRTQEWSRNFCQWNAYLLLVREDTAAFSPYELDPKVASSSQCDNGRWHELEVVDATTLRSTVPGSGDDPIVFTRVGAKDGADGRGAKDGTKR
ncbi:serine/threonine-protein kinase [Streptomyces polyrhachis]|uniref:serine/threonine-protein kinase n=1 Tax=Streptomyces polyrhachis TaxID=1282885 RepID=UPI003AA7C2CF